MNTSVNNKAETPARASGKDGNFSADDGKPLPAAVSFQKWEIKEKRGFEHDYNKIKR